MLGDGAGAEALVRGDKGASETGEPVTVREDGFALDGVEGLADFAGRVFVVIEVGNESGADSSLGSTSADSRRPKSYARKN